MEPAEDIRLAPPTDFLLSAVTLKGTQTQKYTQTHTGQLELLATLKRKESVNLLLMSLSAAPAAGRHWLTAGVSGGVSYCASSADASMH